ncbi:molybdopterin synthase sulfur carrier subunit [Pseudomonas matsuisoli]|uniref:Molybdopterin synthase sulfur carrier subunit n=2 Tax=Pseudomonas matsuisoli TaxID=1515666 RepID=A0A917PL46_9PSED|nr:molybdopterin synthase sulfur carrier subunit [Pseudomonas matsuisoli]
MNIHYFARYREVLGVPSETMEWDPTLVTLNDLRKKLAARGGVWVVLEERNLMCALNQELCGLDSRLQAEDEVAFFPTVTGG